MTALPRLPPLSRILGRALPFVALAAGAGILMANLPGLDAAALWAAVRATPAHAWAWAAVLTALSFFAVGRTDGIVHEALGTGIAPARAAAAGRPAVALSQTLGFAGVTGTLARWRRLPELGPAGAAAVTLTATAAFGLAVAFILGLLVTLGGGPAALPAALAVGAAALVAARLPPLPRLPGLRPRLVLRLVLWTAMDVAAAGAVLAVLLPAEVAATDMALAFVTALGLGLVSQSPGGVGVFEATLMALLPQVPAADLLAAVLCYRVAYHAGPAALALVLLAREPRPVSAGLVPVAAPALGRVLARAPQAEWGLAHQGAQVLLRPQGEAGWLVRRAGQRLVALGLPLGRPDLAGLQATAAAEGRAPLLYKCDARTAARARAAGWRTLRVGQEAILDLGGRSADAQPGRQLRRKLRAAAGVHLVVLPPGADLPLPAMSAVHSDWTRRVGPERGFSMGRFDPGLLARQAVVLAWREGELLAFATFHVGSAEWTLDLLRHAAAAPDGTMHAIVVEAAGRARSAGAHRLSLAAIPSSGSELLERISPLAARLLAPTLPGAGGLGQFKRCFAPSLLPRYAAAPGPLALGLGLARVAWAIRQPGAPLAPKVQVEPAGAPCDARADVPCPSVPVAARAAGPRPRPRS